MGIPRVGNNQGLMERRGREGSSSIPFPFFPIQLPYNHFYTLSQINMTLLMIDANYMHQLPLHLYLSTIKAWLQLLVYFQNHFYCVFFCYPLKSRLAVHSQLPLDQYNYQDHILTRASAAGCAWTAGKTPLWPKTKLAENVLMVTEHHTLCNPTYRYLRKPFILIPIANQFKKTIYQIYKTNTIFQQMTEFPMIVSLIHH